MLEMTVRSTVRCCTG